MIGHSRPLFFGFKGGKGGVGRRGFRLATEPLVCAVLLGIFLIEVAVTRIVSLGSIIIAALYPCGHSYQPDCPWGQPAHHIVFSTICCVIMAAMVIWLHRSNIERLKTAPSTALDKRSNLSQRHRMILVMRCFCTLRLIVLICYTKQVM